MKNKNYHKKHAHQHIQAILSHRISLLAVLFLMMVTASCFDGRVREVMQQAYSESWTWASTYLHHEHPMHLHNSVAFARFPTTSGPGPR
jgi:hypothetical protein